MLCNYLYKFGRDENFVHERQSSEQTERVDETCKPRDVINLQHRNSGRKSVRLAHVFVMRRVRHMLGSTNGKTKQTILRL